MAYPSGIFSKEAILAAAATGLAALPYPINLLLSANPLPKGAAYACSGFASRGGVSHCDARRLRGQSTIEYVLLIAIIGLVVIVAGPGVASAIRNQFGAVTGALGNGISKGDWEAGGSGTGSGMTSDADIYDPVNGTAFAVYSEDDRSLMFYKRRGVPAVGNMFNSRRVTEVYTGFEDNCYKSVNDCFDTGSIDNGDTDCPWYARHNDVRKVLVVDEGIKPKWTQFWFQGFRTMTDCDISKLDMTENRNLTHMFWRCENLENLNVSCRNINFEGSLNSVFCHCHQLKVIDLTSWKVKPTTIRWLFAYCTDLTEIRLGDFDFSNCSDAYCTFYESGNVIIDCSDWNMPSVAEHHMFAYNAPGVTKPSVW